MDPVAVRLLARIGAIEIPVENIYAVALMQTRDPAGTARRWAAQAAAHSAVAAASAAKAGLSLRAGADADGVDRALAAALAVGMANELGAIFGRIIERLDRHARDQPTAGRA